MLGQERPLIGDIVDLHPDGLASSVAGARLHANQHRIRATLRSLQSGAELVAVPWHHAIVVIRAQKNASRYCARFTSMKRAP